MSPLYFYNHFIKFQATFALEQFNPCPSITNSRSSTLGFLKSKRKFYLRRFTYYYILTSKVLIAFLYLAAAQRHHSKAERHIRAFFARVTDQSRRYPQNNLNTKTCVEADIDFNIKLKHALDTGPTIVLTLLSNIQRDITPYYYYTHTSVILLSYRPHHHQIYHAALLVGL